MLLYSEKRCIFGNWEDTLNAFSFQSPYILLLAMNSLCATCFVVFSIQDDDEDKGAASERAIKLAKHVSTSAKLSTQCYTLKIVKKS